LSRLVRFVERHGYSLWIATSMGQAATIAEPIGRQLYMTDPGRFLQRLGVPTASWSRRPAMAPDVNVLVEPSLAGSLREKLRRVTIAGVPLEFQEAPGGFFSFRLGQPNVVERTDLVVMDGSPVP
jgi:hypothetical protein